MADDQLPDDFEVPDDLSALLDGPTEDPSVVLVITQVAAPAPLAAACAIAKLLRAVPVNLLERREGQITASRWAGGERDGDLPAGLVLSDAPPVLEDLLLGSVQAGDVEGVVTSVGMSRWQAMRTIASSAKRK
jgi:hypothetical protein